MLLGLDLGYFADCLTAPEIFPPGQVDVQYYGDVRKLPSGVLSGVDAVVYLAAISNDPMSVKFEGITKHVNQMAALQIACHAKEMGAKTFVFASSCSVYGYAEGGPRNEDAPVNPLTAYAKSKVFAERELEQLADPTFKVTCLRFSTACGMSDRLRLDLVLNDFVANAIASGKISILSDGTPWRPLIHIKDMARAIDWGIQRHPQEGGEFLTINVGSNEWNYQVKDLAEAVAKVIPGVEVLVNKNAQPDKRSYRVSFDRFAKLAPDFQPQIDLNMAVEDLKKGLTAMNFKDKDFRSSRLMRLNVLNQLTDTGLLTNNLEWSHHHGHLIEV
jgi:nucleoside-diphosphate-sugar epimerase